MKKEDTAAVVERSVAIKTVERNINGHLLSDSNGCDAFSSDVLTDYERPVVVSRPKHAIGFESVAVRDNNARTVLRNTTERSLGSSTRAIDGDDFLNPRQDVRTAASQEMHQDHYSGTSTGADGFVLKGWGSVSANDKKIKGILAENASFRTKKEITPALLYERNTLGSFTGSTDSNTFGNKHRKLGGTYAVHKIGSVHSMKSGSSLIHHLNRDVYTRECQYYSHVDDGEANRMKIPVKARPLVETEGNTLQGNGNNALRDDASSGLLWSDSAPQTTKEKKIDLSGISITERISSSRPKRRSLRVVSSDSEGGSDENRSQDGLGGTTTGPQAAVPEKNNSSDLIADNRCTKTQMSNNNKEQLPFVLKESQGWSSFCNTSFNRSDPLSNVAIPRKKNPDEKWTTPSNMPSVESLKMATSSSLKEQPDHRKLNGHVHQHQRCSRPTVGSLASACYPSSSATGFPSAKRPEQTFGERRAGFRRVQSSREVFSTSSVNTLSGGELPRSFSLKEKTDMRGINRTHQQYHQPQQQPQYHDHRQYHPRYPSFSRHRRVPSPHSCSSGSENEELYTPSILLTERFSGQGKSPRTSEKIDHPDEERGLIMSTGALQSSNRFRRRVDTNEMSESELRESVESIERRRRRRRRRQASLCFEEQYDQESCASPSKGSSALSSDSTLGVSSTHNRVRRQRPLVVLSPPSTPKDNRCLLNASKASACDRNDSDRSRRVSEVKGSCDELATSTPGPIPVQTIPLAETPPATQAPKPLQVPPQVPTSTPTEAPNEAPTQAPTEAPTQALREAPTQALREAPTQAPTSTATEAPTEASTPPLPLVTLPTQAPPPTQSLSTVSVSATYEPYSPELDSRDSLGIQHSKEVCAHRPPLVSTSPENTTVRPHEDGSSDWRHSSRGTKEGPKVFSRELCILYQHLIDSGASQFLFEKHYGKTGAETSSSAVPHSAGQTISETTRTAATKRLSTDESAVVISETRARQPGGRQRLNHATQRSESKAGSGKSAQGPVQGARPSKESFTKGISTQYVKRPQVSEHRLRVTLQHLQPQSSRQSLRVSSPPFAQRRRSISLDEEEDIKNDTQTKDNNSEQLTAQVNQRGSEKKETVLPERPRSVVLRKNVIASQSLGSSKKNMKRVVLSQKGLRYSSDFSSREPAKNGPSALAEGGRKPPGSSSAHRHVTKTEGKEAKSLQHASPESGRRPEGQDLSRERQDHRSEAPAEMQKLSQLSKNAAHGVGKPPLKSSRGESSCSGVEPYGLTSREICRHMSTVSTASTVVPMKGPLTHPVQKKMVKPKQKSANDTAEENAATLRRQAVAAAIEKLPGTAPASSKPSPQTILYKSYIRRRRVLMHEEKDDDGQKEHTRKCGESDLQVEATQTIEDAVQKKKKSKKNVMSQKVSTDDVQEPTSIEHAACSAASHSRDIKGGSVNRKSVLPIIKEHEAGIDEDDFLVVDAQPGGFTSERMASEEIASRESIGEGMEMKKSSPVGPANDRSHSSDGRRHLDLLRVLKPEKELQHVVTAGESSQNGKQKLCRKEEIQENKTDDRHKSKCKQPVSNDVDLTNSTTHLRNTGNRLRARFGTEMDDAERTKPVITEGEAHLLLSFEDDVHMDQLFSDSPVENAQSLEHNVEDVGEIHRFGAVDTGEGIVEQNGLLAKKIRTEENPGVAHPSSGGSAPESRVEMEEKTSQVQLMASQTISDGSSFVESQYGSLSQTSPVQDDATVTSQPFKKVEDFEETFPKPGQHLSENGAQSVACADTIWPAPPDEPQGSDLASLPWQSRLLGLAKTQDMSHLCKEFLAYRLLPPANSSTVSQRWQRCASSLLASTLLSNSSGVAEMEEEGSSSLRSSNRHLFWPSGPSTFV